MVKAEDQAGLDGDAGGVKLFDAVQIAVGLVEGFARFLEAGHRNGFKADKERLATAGRGELDEVIVIHDVEGGLAGPAFAQRNQAGGKVPGRSPGSR